MRRVIFTLSAIATLLMSTAVTEASCIKRHTVRIATGTSPSGLAWSVEGSIGNNGNCRQWLFGMDFDLEGATTWSSGSGIPAGGHLVRGDNEPSAFDTLLDDGSDRVVSGFVNGEVAKVLFTLSNNKHLAIQPESVPMRLRQKVVWLRNVRYFVAYYPPEAFVTGISTFDASGQLLYRDKSFEQF